MASGKVDTSEIIPMIELFEQFTGADLTPAKKMLNGGVKLSGSIHAEKPVDSKTTLVVDLTITAE